ncbi:hypothetical protein DMH08_11900 [Actinomadura sp. WAC 06369]|nr:hypothetical protein DMH08_11900 [Actinomadura sp. WAC 06369]
MPMVAAVAMAVTVVWILGPGAKWWLVNIDGVDVEGKSALAGKDLAAALDAVRGRVLTVITGIAAVVAIYYTALNAASARQSAHAAIKGVKATEESQLRMHALTAQGQRYDRFTAAVEHLGNPTPAIRLGGVHALARLADDSPELRQTCIDILCAYLRLPYEPNPDHSLFVEQDPTQLAVARADYQAHREVRHTIIRIIASRLRDDAVVSWQGHDLDFTNVVFDGGNFQGATFSGQTFFTGATFYSGHIDFDYACFTDGVTDFSEAKFEAGDITFWKVHFKGANVRFWHAEFQGSTVLFTDAIFHSGVVDFTNASFKRGVVSFRDAHFGEATLKFEGASGKRPSGLPDDIASEWP